MPETDAVLRQALENAPLLLPEALLLDDRGAVQQLSQHLLGRLQRPHVGGDVQDVEGTHVVQAPPGQTRVPASLGSQGHVDVAHVETEVNVHGADLLEVPAPLRRQALGVAHHDQEGGPFGCWDFGHRDIPS